MDSVVAVCASDVSLGVSVFVELASDVGFDSVVGTWLVDGVLTGASVPAGSCFCGGVETVSLQPTRTNKKQQRSINVVILFITDVIVVKGETVVNWNKLAYNIGISARLD